MPDWADPIPEDQPVELDDIVKETEDRLEEADEKTRSAEKPLHRPDLTTE